MKNGKSYIGKTYQDVYTRLNEHFSDAKRFPKRPLYAAFNKYGLDSFSMEIIGYFEQGQLELEEMLAIERYRTFGNTGYNATLGGEGTRYINIPDIDIIEKYQEFKTIAAVSRFFKIDVATVTKVLKSNDVCVAQKPVIGAIAVKILDPEITFESLKSCARFLIECELTQALNLTGISSHIREAAKNGNKYLGLRFKLLNN